MEKMAKKIRHTRQISAKRARSGGRGRFGQLESGFDMDGYDELQNSYDEDLGIEEMDGSMGSASIIKQANQSPGLSRKYEQEYRSQNTSKLFSKESQGASPCRTLSHQESCDTFDAALREKDKVTPITKNPAWQNLTAQDLVKEVRIQERKNPEKVKVKMFGWHATQIAKYRKEEKSKKQQELMGTGTQIYRANIEKQEEFLADQKKLKVKEQAMFDQLQNRIDVEEMISKFENFAEEEEQREHLASRPDSNDPDATKSPTMSVKNKQGKEETFERSIFDPDKYIQFDSAVKNIIHYNSKQKSFENRRDDISRKAYQPSRNGAIFSSAGKVDQVQYGGYTDKFVLSQKNPKLDMSQRFNQHSKHPMSTTSRSGFLQSRPKISTGQALFNLNQTMPKRNRFDEDQTMPLKHKNQKFGVRSAAARMRPNNFGQTLQPGFHPGSFFH